MSFTTTSLYRLKHIEGTILDVKVSKLSSTRYAELGKEFEGAIQKQATKLAKAALSLGVNPADMKGMDETKVLEIMLSVGISADDIDVQFDMIKDVDALCLEVIAGWKGTVEIDGKDLTYSPETCQKLIVALPIACKKDLVSAALALTNHGAFPGEDKSSSNLIAS